MNEKILEALCQGKEKMTDTMFCRMIGEHKAWMTNNNGSEYTKKTRNVFSQRKGPGDTSRGGKKVIICWGCWNDGYFNDKCPDKPRAQCRKC